MPRPAAVAAPPGMTAKAVNDWIEEVKAKKIASTDVAIATMLGRSHDTLVAMRKRGADRVTALACAAILKKLDPYGGAPRKVDEYVASVVDHNRTMTAARRRAAAEAAKVD